MVISDLSNSNDSPSPIPPTGDLKDILCLVYEYEKKRDELTWRCACLLAAEDTGDHDWCTTSAEERTKFRAVGNGEESLDTVRKDDRLRPVVLMKWLELARIQTRKEESQRLGRSLLANTSWEVMYEAVIEAVLKLVPNMSHLDDPMHTDGWEPGFKEFCEWLGAGQGPPFEQWLEAFMILNEAGIHDHLLERLWRECDAECKDIPLPNPPARETVVNIDEPILSIHASAIYKLLLSQPTHAGMTGAMILTVLSKDGIIIDPGSLTSRYLPELKPYGLENKKRIGYRIPESRRPPR